MKYEIYEEDNDIKVKIVVETKKGDSTYFVLNSEALSVFVNELRDIQSDILMKRIQKAMSKMPQKIYETKMSNH